MFNAGSMLEGGFGLIKRQPTSVVLWGVVYFGVTLASAMMMRPFVGITSMAAGGDPQAAFGQMATFLRNLFLFELLVLALFVAMFAAPVRAVLRPADARFFYLRLGMDEVRLFALSIVLVIFFYVVLMIGTVAVAIVGGILGAAAGPLAAVPVVIIAAFALFGGFVWLWVRLSLAFPLTLLRRKIIIGESWRLTRGRFWSLFGAYFVLWVIVIVIMSLAMSLNFGSYWSAMATSAGDPKHFEAIQQQMVRNMGQITATNLIVWTLSSIGGALMIALFGGAMATAVRELVGDESGLAETFA